MLRNDKSSIKEQIDNLSSQEKLRLLAKLKSKQKQQPLMNPAGLETPLSHAQRRLWLIEQLGRCSYLYHVPLIVNLPPIIDIPSLATAWKQVVQENPILSSEFITQNDEITQCHRPIDEYEIITLECPEDLPNFVEISESSPLADFFLTEFQTNQAPLWRIALLKTPTKNYLLACFHHLIIDGWSMSLLIKRLNWHYQAVVSHAHPVSLVPEENSYQSFVVWEQQFGHSEKNIQYWLNRLQGKAFTVDLVTDYPRQSMLSGHGKTWHAVIPAENFQALQQFARDQAISINHCILFAFQFLLGRYSGQDEITVGIPVPGRIEQRWYNTIGLFVNTCLHTMNIDYQLTVSQQLNWVKKQLLTDMAHANEPFDEIIKMLYARKQINPNNAFNILYNYVQYEFSEHQETIHATHHCTLPSSKFDLSLHVYAGASATDLFIEYSTDLYCAETVQHMMDYLLHLLAMMPNDSQKTLRAWSWELHEEEDLG